MQQRKKHKTNLLKELLAMDNRCGSIIPRRDLFTTGELNALINEDGLKE